MVEQSGGTARISRRRVLAGVAWSAPAILVATAVPAAAASDPDNPNNRVILNSTAVNVSGTTGNSAFIEGNGIRVSPLDPLDPPMVKAGSVATITVRYTGSNPTFSFLDTPFGIQHNLNMSMGWAVSYSETELVFVAPTPFDSIEPTIGSFTWFLNANNRPEDDSIVFTGVLVLAPGGGFPNGGTVTPLVVDANMGTGAITGPTEQTWAP